MKKLLIVLLMMATLYGCGAKEAEEANPGHEGAATGEASAEVTVRVSVKKLSPVTFEHFFLANGAVEAVKDAFISPEINGQVKKIHVKEGQRVKKGQLLVSLNSDVTRNTIAEVKTGLQLARTIYEKRKGLWEKKIGSEVQYLQAKMEKESLEHKLKTLQAQLAMANITAPINGIVDEVSNKEGELAVPGMQLIRLVNLQKVYINADVSEAYLPKLEKGAPVHVTFPSYPDIAVDSIVHRTGHVVKAQNRTFLVQVLLDNSDERLKPNIVALLKMKDFSAENALVVPSIIIKNDLQGSYLYVVERNKGKNLARKTYVTPGVSEGSNTMVTKGLKPGEQVIVEGYNLVKNGQEVVVDDKQS